MNKRRRTKKPPLLIAWDTETYKVQDQDQETILRPHLVGWWCEGKFNYSLEPHTDFFNFLVEKAKTHSLKLWCFNAMYDLPVILPEYLSKYDKKYEIDYKVSDNKNFISFKYVGTKLKFKCFDAAVWNRHIQSLDNWFKLLGLPSKKSYNYDKWNLTYDDKKEIFHFYDSEGNKQISTLYEELDYLWWDCEGLYKVVEHQMESRKYLCDLFKFDHTKINSNTAPSFAKKLINLWKGDGYFDSRFRPITHNEHLYNIMSVSSCGGFTACNKLINQIVSNDGLIKSYDVNSMYPAVMVHGVPAGELLKEKPKGKYVTWYECSMKECEWIDSHSYISTPPLPSRWCKLKQTFFLIKDYYDIVKEHMKSDIIIHDIYYQIHTNELRDLVIDLYHEKVKESLKPDSFEKKINTANQKLLLNSIYGKLMERTYFEEHYYDQYSMQFTSNKLHVTNFRYNLSGVYVAQKARAYLIKTLLKEIDNGNTFLYSDTDSLKIVENNPVLFKVHEHHLGWFKLERCSDKNEGFTHFLSTGKIKKYLLYHKDDLHQNMGVKMALSGVSRKIQGYLIKFGNIEQFKELFKEENNIVIIQGKLSNERNKWGQSLLNPIDISLNASHKHITHKLHYNEALKTIQIDKV